MNHNNQAGSRVFVVGICGSLRRGSYTRMAVQMALQGAQEVGTQTRLIDLKDYQLVSCDGKEDESTYPADVFRLRREVSQAQGIILGTPEYHGSFSGVLKNALDLMGFDEIEASRTSPLRLMFRGLSQIVRRSKSAGHQPSIQFFGPLATPVNRSQAPLLCLTSRSSHPSTLYMA